jgi:hypothetical protein
MESMLCIVRRIGIRLALLCLMRELGTGSLMLLACGAVYVQNDPTIWNSLSLLFVRFIG